MGDFDFKTTHFKVTGFRDIYKSLDAVPANIKRRDLEQFLAEAFLPMKEAARRYAPDDPLTGPPWDLKSSIEIGSRQRTGRSKTDRPLGRFDARIYMGPTRYGYPQAMFAEFGTGLRFHKKSGKSVGSMAARPYMRPAWDAHKAQVVKFIQVRFGNYVKNILMRHATAGQDNSPIPTSDVG